MTSFLSTRFASCPVMVAEHMSDWAESCLKSLSAVENIEAMLKESCSLDQDDFWPPEGDWRASYRPYHVKDGVLQIPVRGMLLHNFSYSVFSWATGYNYIERAFSRGLADPQVKAIAFMINSGGGEVAGNFDMVDRIYAQREVKPIHSIVDESAFSAAYSIASLGRISVPRTGAVGSIGVVTSHVDMSAAMEQRGYKITFIHAGKHKVDGNPYESLDAGAKARIQSRIDALYDIFVSTVSRNRGVSNEAVRGTEALTFSASDAVALGLADEVVSAEKAVVALSAQNTTIGVVQMTDAITKEVHDNALAIARAEGAREGATQERERINAIISCEEATDRDELAKTLAMQTDMSVDMAKVVLAATPAAAKMQENPANPFLAAMEQGNPEVGQGGNPAPVAKTGAEAILADFKAVTGQ